MSDNSENSLQAFMQAQLNERRAQSLYRERTVVQSPQGVELKVDGKSFVNFCSNDYLGLANHPEIIKALKQAADNYGVGSGASHLICGHTAEHHALEEELADFVGAERALLFSTGYMANLGLINSLVGRGDLVLEDKLNHASLLDGGLLSQADFKRYQHVDMQALEKRLQSTMHETKNANSAKTLIVTDAVFSMDGNVAPLAVMSKLAKQYQATLMIDDAHGFGVLGEQGRGAMNAAGLGFEDIPVYMATLGKAIGVGGAFVAGSDSLIEYLIQFARPYIYTTAMPAAMAAAIRQSLKLLVQESWRQQQLTENIQLFKRLAEQNSIDLMASETAIQPVVIGPSEKAFELSKKLKEKGFWLTAIRPPTVPEGSARLRITLSADHLAAQIEKLVEVLAEVLHEA